MEELDKVKPTDVTLMLGGKERQIKFGFSAWAKFEEMYGNISNLNKMQEEMQEKPFTTCRKLIWLGLKDKDGLTEETVLDDYGMNDINFISETLSKAIYGSLPKNDTKKRQQRRIKRIPVDVSINSVYN